MKHKILVILAVITLVVTFVGEILSIVGWRTASQVLVGIGWLMLVGWLCVMAERLFSGKVQEDEKQ